MPTVNVLCTYKEFTAHSLGTPDIDIGDSLIIPI